MTIDGFTLIAQVVNFALLLLLLRVFLFRPIQRVMREREERIARAYAEAHDARAEAEARAEELGRERERFEAERRERMAALEREVARERDEKLAEVAAEAEAAREAWRDAFEREREALAEDVRDAAAAVLRDALERGWRELADADLEAHALTAFARHLADLDPEDRAALAEAVRVGPVRFATAFEATEAQREALRDATREAIAAADGGEADPLDAATFVRDPDLLAGVRLRAGDRRVGWTLRAHLEDLERAWSTLEPSA
jgi:F-type H+-transporting ATPase subunit b